MKSLFASFLVAVIAFPSLPSSSAFADDAVVTLGTGDLVKGIPGEGPLTNADIAKWLANPKNHVELKPKLPFGLDAAAGNIFIPEDNPMTRAKIELGRQLYFDTRLSSDNTISCASCHNPSEGYGAHTRFGVGVRKQEGGRNSPVSYNRIVSTLQFWDGRAASLEDQAIGPIANAIEMANTHEACVAMLKKVPGYVVQFEKIFKDGVTIENAGRAMATFERAIVTGPTAFDYDEQLTRLRKAYAEDLEDLEALRQDEPELVAKYEMLVKGAKERPLFASARNGKVLFFGKANCATCHAGANFTDEQYHNLGVGMEAKEPDLGRYEITKEEKDRGAFKTPTIRNVALSGPYMHDGSQKTLEEVVEWYDKGGHKNPWLSDKMKPLNLTAQEKADLVAFMKDGLTGSFPEVETGRLPQ